MAEQIVERWNKPMMAMHWIHMITCLILIVTGFRIYLGWGFPSTYSQARALHMVAVCGFLVANCILLPYAMIAGGLRREMKLVMFAREDARRLKAAVLNFFDKKKKYPTLTTYNAATGHYESKSHPITKILIPLEGIALILITVTGIVMYNPNWTIFGINLGAAIMSVATRIGAVFGLGGAVFCRALHLGVMYYFVLDIFIHVGILQADPKLKQAWKAMFLTGKEDIKASGYAKIVKK